MTALSHRLLWLKDITKQDTHSVGETAVKLGALLQEGFPIPDGFVISSQTYIQFLHDNKLIKPINDLLTTINYDYPESVQQVAEHIKKRIMTTKLPDSLSTTISQAYHKLNGNFHNFPVSLVIEPTHTTQRIASLSKQRLTDIHGDANLLLKVKQAWVSNFDPDKLLERHRTHQDHFQSGITIIIQKNVEAEQKGIILTQDPATHKKYVLIIETSGDAIDHFEIDKQSESPRLMTKHIAGTQQVLSDKQLFTLATLGKDIEKFSYFPQEIAWAIEKGKIVIEDLRPLQLFNSFDKTPPLTANLPLLLRGIPASLGRATGPIRFIESQRDFEKVLHGEILVAHHLDTTHKQAIKKAAALITDTGGRTSPIALLARDLGIPAVVGTTHATKNLKSRQIVTVDGSTGMLYQGALTFASEIKRLTATRLYQTVTTIPHDEHSESDGILLLNNDHPTTMTTTNLPIIYKLADSLPDNKNLLFGYHGTYRLLAEPAHLQKELEVIRNLQKAHEFHPITILIPYVRSLKEFYTIKQVLHDQGVQRSAKIKLWMDIALPGNLFLLEEFITLGIDGIAIDADTLTMLLLGTERDDSFISHAFDDLDPAVLKSIETAIKTAQKHRIVTAIYGHAPSHHPALIEKLVSWGITTICAEEDRIHEVRQEIAKAERRVIENT